MVKLRSLIAAGMIAAAAPGVVSAQRPAAPFVKTAAAPPRAGSVAQRITSIAAQGHGAGRTHIIVELASPPDGPTRERLRRAGLEILEYVGDRSYLASVASSRLDGAALAEEASIIGASEIAPSAKMQPLLASGRIPGYARPSAPSDGGGRSSGAGPVVVYVLFHADVRAASAGQEVVAHHGGEVRTVLRTVNGLVVELPEENLDALAREDSVEWMELPLPPLEGVNDSNRLLTQAEEVQAAPYGLDGTGVSVLIFDGGAADETHPDFGGRLTDRDEASPIDHSTHVAGTIGGDGTESGGLYRGMAPGVTMESYGLRVDGSDIFLYSNPGDIEYEYQEAINVYGVDIANNSLGTNTCANGFPCEITGDYGVTASILDGIVRGSLGRPITVFWANGNERADRGTCTTGHCCRCIDEGIHTPDGYHSTAPPACAKNPIHVGAVNSNDDTVTFFTSWGPCDDGRLKPEIVAPGCQTTDDMGVTSCNIGGGYLTACGTSMATPTATGLAALLLEDFRAHYPGREDPRNATIKALFAHNAVDLGNPGPDFQSGYGSVRIRDTIDFVRGGSFFEGELQDAQQEDFIIRVSGGTESLKVTLAWDDAPATPLAAVALVNDLDLHVVSPSGTRYYPWNLDPAGPAQPATRTAPDHRNVIEQVFVESPEAGDWRVSVVGYLVPVGPQTFGICSTPFLERDCDGDGIIDAEQIAADPALDCSGNGILDTCEPDCNTNGIADSCDIAAGSSNDCNDNGVPDLCDLVSGLSADCNANTRPDECDIADHLDDDCNGNLVPDGCEADCNGNGVADGCDIAAMTASDCNGNAIPDTCDLAAGTSADTNVNEIPDECEGPVVYVDQNATGRDNGSTWQDAFTDLQRALVIARSSSGVREIWVAAGTYRPSAADDRTASFDLVNGVAVLGGFAGSETESSERDWVSHPTVLSGDIGAPGDHSDNSYHVVTVGPDVGSSGVLDGLAIVDGNADGPLGLEADVGGAVYNGGGGPTFRNCSFRTSEALGAYPGGGGAMYNTRGAEPILVRCTFSGNSSTFGGAIYNTLQSKPVLEGCRFEENVALSDGGAIFNAPQCDGVVRGCYFASNLALVGAGSAITNDRSSPQIVGCEFEGNGHSTARKGGAIADVAASPTIVDCVFRDNVVVELGGAVFNWIGSSPIIADCVFIHNRTTGFGGRGAAIHNRDSHTVVRNCLFAENVSNWSAGVASANGSTVQFTNCTMHRNQARFGGALDAGRSNIQVRNSIIWDNTAEDCEGIVLWDFSTIGVMSSDFPGGAASICPSGLGDTIELAGSNIDADPVFVRNVYGAHFLSQSAAGQGAQSPCVDAGDDLAQTLILDGRTTRTDGVGDAGVVDMGYHAMIPDCNSNGVPDHDDIAAGTSADCPGNPNGIPDSCEPDCDSNGVVDSCAIARGDATDCDDNWVPDNCETLVDCNTNDVHDPCDVQSGASDDCDLNLVPDECQADCDHDGLPDVCELAPLGESADCNTNGVPDECDVSGGGSDDCDGNVVPDECQPDCNGNGQADSCDISGGLSRDCNSNAVPDACDLAGGTSVDADNSGVPDECETDCNGNGVADLFDIASGTSTDCDLNAVPDECDPDCNGNGTPDACDLAGWTSFDCDDNGVPDECDIAAGAQEDCNANGRPDQCELDGGRLLHTFHNPHYETKDYFGLSVAGTEDLLFIGAPQENTVYIYDAATADMVRTLTSPESGGAFGSSITILGDRRVLIGATSGDAAVANCGEAYIFDADTGQLIRTFAGPTPAAGDYFGGAVAALGENRIVIGAPRRDVGGLDTGEAYVFDAESGALLHTLANPTPADREYFGYAVAGVGDDVVVGAYGEQTMGRNAGAVYVFDGETGALLRTLFSPTPDPTDSFGVAVTEVNGKLLVGAPLDDTAAYNSGAAYLFDATTGDLIHTFTNPSAGYSDQFGSALSQVAGDVIVGAILHDAGAEGSGAVWLFDGGTFAVRHVLSSPTPEDYDNFGAAVAGAGRHVLVGAWRDDNDDVNAGAAYLFDVEWDCNTNATIDACDASSGASPDHNGNLVPDECEICGDLDGDVDVDTGDYAVLVAAMGSHIGQTAYNPAADLDGDGVVSLLDYQSWLLCLDEFGGSPAASRTGDYDADGDVDAADFQALAACIAGPGAVPTARAPYEGTDCLGVFDLDADGDIDARDLALFQAAVTPVPTGPNPIDGVSPTTPRH